MTESDNKNNDERIFEKIKKCGKDGIFEKELFELYHNEISIPTIKRIIKKHHKSSSITKKRFGQQVKLFANPQLPRGHPHPIINANIHQSFIVESKHYSLNQIIDLHNLSPESEPYPVGVYLDRCLPLPAKPKIKINDSPVKYDIIETAPHEIRFKIRGEIPSHGLHKRSDEMKFNYDYYHLLHIERPTNYIQVKIQYKNITPPAEYPLCEEWVKGTITKTYQFTQISKNFFQLEIPQPIFPNQSYYKTLFFPKPKNR